MLTIITGTPGAGKSLYAVWEEARKVPGSTVEADGKAVPRRLLCNIKDLLVDHEHIGPEQLATWHEWAQPGDVIVYDEVQEVWRPRGLGTKVPDCIAALETHRHKGVDIILITQHPMLVDPNIRRLCNRHLHLRRITKGTAFIYEWDHCANPGQVKSCINSRVWFHPKKAYALYKSAQLHTKPTARLPRIALVGVAALAGIAYLAPTAYGRISERFTDPGSAASVAKAKPATPAQVTTQPLAGGAGLPARTTTAEAAPVTAPEPVSHIGCIKFRNRCECFTDRGQRMEVEPLVCEEGSHRVGFVMPAGHGGEGRGTRPSYASQSGNLAPADPAATDNAPSQPAPPVIPPTQPSSAS